MLSMQLIVEVTSEDKDFPVEGAFVVRGFARVARGRAGESNDSTNLRPHKNSSVYRSFSRRTKPSAHKSSFCSGRLMAVTL